MRTLTLTFLGALLLGPGVALAQTCDCSGADQIKGQSLMTALLGNTVCVPNGGDWFWQEQHRSSLQLWDYKKGSNPADPSEQVGTWSAGGTGANTLVTHSYSGGSTFSYKVCRVGSSSSYGFCPAAGGATIMATIKPGISGCP